MRKPFFAANWKMHKLQGEARDFAAEFLPLMVDVNNADVVVCPPFTALATLDNVIHDSNVQLGAQNVFWEEKGAYTGEISAPMLVDVGCSYVIVGHSERRSIIGENNSIIRRKLEAVLSAGLIPIFCVGETLDERENNQAHQVVKEQLEEGLRGISFADRGLVIAYEPVWAIGTGVIASPEDAQEMSGFIRSCVLKLYGEKIAATLPILYGGSVKPDNIGEIMSRRDVDGALVGGASLNATDFAKIVRIGKDV